MDEIRISHGAWVVVADGEKALFLRNEGNGADPRLEVFREEEIDNPPTREQGTGRPGRLSDSGAGGQQRSAVEQTDWKQIGKERFAKTLADILGKAAMANRYDHLVIAADPSTLGELRKDLHKTVQDRLVATFDKDLTKMPVDRIEALLFGG